MAPYRPNRKTRRNKKYKKLMSEENTNNEEVQAPEINVGDLSAVLQVIDVCTERGAFKGPELSSIGLIRDKVAAFVNFHAPKTEEAEEETPAEETADGAEATEETSE
jgi:hypothetical protein